MNEAIFERLIHDNGLCSHGYGVHESCEQCREEWREKAIDYVDFHLRSPARSPGDRENQRRDAPRARAGPPLTDIGLEIDAEFLL